MNKRILLLLSLIAAAIPSLGKTEHAYGKHKDQKLDLYAPDGATNAPVMLFVHGGAWQIGDKRAVAQKPGFFNDQGWIFLSANYRLLPDGRHPENVEDIAAAIAWVHNNIRKHGGDPEQIFIMGHSAGAHLVALVATDDRPLKKKGKPLSTIKGVISLDTQAYDIPTLIAESATKTYREVFSNDPEIQTDASPIHHIQKGKGIPPFLICYSRGMGLRKQPGRNKQADAFAAALEAAGIHAETVDATDRNHSAINKRFGDPKDEKVTGKALEFLNAILNRQNVGTR